MRTVLVIAFALVVAGCGSSSSSGRTSVVAAFYPAAFAADEIGGAAVDVRNLTPAGAEPHDIELTPKDVAALQRADVVVYLSDGFQPAVEQALRGATGEKVDLLAGLARGNDPHVWLDPVKYAAMVRRIGGALGRRDQAAALADRALRLDAEYRRGLSQCDRREFVTSHDAFGYLASRYRLKQVPITGVDPASEATGKDLADLVRLVRRLRVPTIFFERLASPKLAQTLAAEAGAHAAVLDPLEGLTPDEAKRGANYFTIMRANLRALREALGCR